MPQEVAVQIASSGFNSPTEKLTDFRSVVTPDGLAWTAFRTPDGAFRIFSKKTQGIVTLNAESTERRVKPTDAELEIAPGQLLTDNLRWRLLKRHYLIDLANPVGALDRQGRPIIIVPYISYKGWLIRRPVLGGVFVVHPDGEIEDLSPDEARKRPEITSTGRLFPDTLARRIQDAYAYKRGIWNRFVLHEEQTQISDTESNQQPYLIDFGDARHQMGDGCRALRSGLRGQCDLPDRHGHGKDRDLARTAQREPQRQPPRGSDRAVRLDPRRGVRRRGREGNRRQVQGRGAKAGVRTRPPAVPACRSSRRTPTRCPRAWSSMPRATRWWRSSTTTPTHPPMRTRCATCRPASSIGPPYRSRSPGAGRHRPAGDHAHARAAAFENAEECAERHSKAPGPVDPATAGHAARNRTAAAGDRAGQVTAS